MAKADTREISGIQRDPLTLGFSDGTLRYPADPLLRAKGAGRLDVYREVLRDDQVKSCFQQRQLALIGCETLVEAGGDRAVDKAAADWLRGQIEGWTRWDEVSAKMLYGLFFGYAIGECLWGYDGSRAVLRDVRVRRPERFRFDLDDRLRLLLPGVANGEIMPPRKFWTFSAGGADDDDPYGLGLAYWLYWPVFFKRNGLKFWAVFLEKFGQPTVTGKFPGGATQEEKDRLLEACRAVSMEAGIIFPEGFEIVLLEAARSGTADYVELARYCDGAIAKVILSQTMTTDDGSSLAQGKVHMEVRDEVVKADQDLLCGSFNEGPVTWLTEWNFPGAEPPRVWRRVESEPDLLELAERDNKIKQLGWEPTDEQIAETYGEGYVRVENPSADADASLLERRPGEGGRPANFAERAADRDALDGLVEAAIAGDGWEPLVAPLVAPIERLVADAASLEEVRDRLAETVARMDTTALEALLERAGLTARLAGISGAPVSDEQGDGA